MKKEAEPAPATILLGVSLLSILIACLTNLAASVLAFIITWGCMLFMQPRHAIKRVLAANAFILFMWVIVPFTAPDKHLYSGFIFSRGIFLCLLITFKANAIIALFISFISPFSSTQLAIALHNLHCPSRLVLIILLVERNIHILGREWRKLEEGARIRCFMPGANLRSYSVIGSMLAILLLRAHDRAKRIYEAMLLAGFDGRMPFRKPWHPGLPDAFFLLLALMSGLAILLPEWIANHG